MLLSRTGFLCEFSASATIPAVFPPGFIKVAAKGGVYDEMHVDGGATREVFLVPTQFMARTVDSA